MRYYNFALNANAEHIKENTTINLREDDEVFDPVEVKECYLTKEQYMKG